MDKKSRVVKTRVPKTRVPKTRVPKSRVPKTRVPKIRVPKSRVPKTRVPKTNSIPKIIHQVWLGSDIPTIQALYMNKWRTMRGWKYILWREEDIIKTNFPKTWFYIQKAIEIGIEKHRNKYAQICDLLRLEILHKYGGLYADATLEPLQNFDTLLNEQDKFVISNEDPCGLDCYASKYKKKYISNSFISSTANNPILTRMLSKKSLDNIDFYSTKVNLETGPFFVRSHIKDTDDITIVPSELIYPFGYESEYRDGNDDLCFSYKKTKKTNVTIKNKNGSFVYLEYPCVSYPKSYAIKHWEVGGSWIVR